MATPIPTKAVPKFTPRSRTLPADDARDDHGLRVRFTIQDATIQSPRIAEIRITNLSEATAQKIPKEGGKVELIAGYRDNAGRIFKGEVKQRRIGRENPTDTYVDIFASTHDRAYNAALVSRTLPAGSTGKDIYMECLKAMKPFGVTQGNLPEALSRMKYPRPVTLFGMARDHLRTLALSAGATWNIRDDQLDVVPKDGLANATTVVLNSQTGLIGLPVQTDAGIVARCLINPALHVNCLVKIDQKSIQAAAFDLSIAGEPRNALLPPIATDGIYRVIALDHVGDTHGQPWYCELYCVAKGTGTTLSQASMGRGEGVQGQLVQPYIGAN